MGSAPGQDDKKNLSRSAIFKRLRAGEDGSSFCKPFEFHGNSDTNVAIGLVKILITATLTDAAP